MREIEFLPLSLAGSFSFKKNPLNTKYVIDSNKTRDWETSEKRSQKFYRIKKEILEILENELCFIPIAQEVYSFLNPEKDETSYNGIVGSWFSTYSVTIDTQEKYYIILLKENVEKINKIITLFTSGELLEYLTEEGKSVFKKKKEKAWDSFLIAIECGAQAKQYKFSMNENFEKERREFLLSTSSSKIIKNETEDTF